eukprot:Blabericola_migrator_1__776@NODE_1195_length_5142_cov_387_875271_g810_i0_p3_GENE_NODE_1195_length_5142_cov_387_875271_g810_i0NODE_1195_length_5142_cov_387_875271_g810_i0_p3_ORF_typecomplete_len269_score41_72OCC1/PF15506_6/0_14_NODE_1195_length_5142_cov_387_875271_g810_i042985104
MPIYTTTHVGPQQVSSHHTTTVRTTQTTSAPMLTTPITTPYISTSGVPVVTHHTYTSGPMMTTTPLLTTPGAGTFMKPLPTMGGSFGTSLGTLSLTPFRPAYGTTSLSGSVPMGLAPATTTSRQSSASQQVTYSNAASLTINGVRCEGYIAAANDRIVEAKNIFIGVAPFVLTQETLEVTPEMSVVARNPDIKCHIGDLPSAEHESLTLSAMRQLAGIEEGGAVYVGLPGQAAALVSEVNGALHFQQTQMPTLIGPPMVGAPLLQRLL